jgi:hypothetical protein
MTNRTIIILGFLNLALLGWVAFLLRNPAQLDGDPAKVPSRAGAVAAPAPSNQQPQLTVGPGQQHNAARFDWRQVESEDYKQYIVNLRAIGCPEKTIREIILADVNDLFATRRATITQTNRYEYWRANPVNLSEAQQNQLRELDSEKAETLKVLGVQSTDFANLLGDYYRSSIEAKEMELDFLPPTKRQQIKDMEFRQSQLMLAAGESSAKAAEIEQQTESAIKSLLTAAEQHDYELRVSVPAAQLRGVLNQLEPTEQEFRIIYDTWIALQTKQAGSVEYREVQRSSEASLQQLLGSNRFQAYLQGVKLLGYSR